jgi:hypothetical protein
MADKALELQFARGPLPPRVEIDGPHAENRCGEPRVMKQPPLFL